MKLLGRTTRPEDLDQCLDILRDGFLYDGAARDDLRKMWLELITCDTGRSAVVVDASDARRVLAFGVSAAIDATRYEAIFSERAPFLGKAFLEDWRNGRRPFLDEAAFATANARDGLYFIVTHNGVSDAIGPEFLAAGLSAISESFIAVHHGCNMNAVVHESFGVPRDFARDLGMSVVDYAPAYARSFAGVPKDRMPPLIISVTREDAKRRPGNLAMNQLFLRFTPPRCALRTSERRVLRLALEGAPDDVIAEVLQIAPRTVKKRWADIYNAMEAITGIDSHLGDGRRGVEVRRHVLRYVREHPEELHAYAGSRPSSR